MGRDFVVAYNPDEDNIQDVTHRIFYSLFIRRIKRKKPAVIFLSGDSGEGKSWAALKIQQVLLGMQGFDLKECLEKVNIYQPLEYGNKLDNLIKKEPKKLNVLIIHEARELVKAKLWHSFINQTISDINAMSRSLKRLVTIIVSQFIRDISTDIRYTITFYCKVVRLANSPARVYIYKMWKDDRDLENPKLRKRRIWGYLRMPNGRLKRYSPKYFELTPPSEEIIKEFERRDYEAKSYIIRNKLNKLIAEMRKELETDNAKVSAMVEWYTKLHPEQLSQIGKQRKTGFYLAKEVKKMHDLNDDEVKDLQQKITEKLKEGGLIEDG